METLKKNMSKRYIYADHHVRGDEGDPVLIADNYLIIIGSSERIEKRLLTKCEKNTKKVGMAQ